MTPRTASLGALSFPRRIEGEASLLQDLSPVIAALVAEQEYANRCQAVTGFPLEMTSSEPCDGDDTVAKLAKRASTSHAGRSAGW